jgi:hypothetical protein
MNGSHTEFSITLTSGLNTQSLGVTTTVKEQVENI